MLENKLLRTNYKETILGKYYRVDTIGIYKRMIMNYFKIKGRVKLNNANLPLKIACEGMAICEWTLSVPYLVLSMPLAIQVAFY
ncbi:hypothetical protein LA535_004880 [Salmonella enterica]|nr:hypothetical protein [Salmonella enterica]ECT8865302.1 hypothetical protein [Salmonella enterica subsp. enterica serovar Pensacola]EDQ0312707.1 hypothetical protein [Salmonella enterica subsp. enterica serovar Berta]EAZ4943105.1 hypothetical protein [Salmonella enterica]EBC1521152.1 hypothetical protein [Salmonella enterica]